ncbi:hypothetical protein KL86DYS1_10974 [uncultured Dysgonomonas sp.]|uniref:Uncharacterized protein n=1 Tax=uncultured Dysgonomonas sp. TaxID=206096 RepID=A0A212J343_9BACT|nr:hypothetical protein KL86DYS1_10974 [uncultured Dysgonomonas sp.]
MPFGIKINHNSKYSKILDYKYIFRLKIRIPSRKIYLQENIC